jgi:hypothetical protein
VAVHRDLIMFEMIHDNDFNEVQVAVADSNKKGGNVEGIRSDAICEKQTFVL